ncbi:MAG: tetratricopeptide repeat protein, partial [Bacteroidota bacterium]
MKLKYLLIFVFFFSFFFGKEFEGVSFAQNRNIDSLLILIKTALPDTNKVNHLTNISREYIIIREYDQGLKYGNKALALANSLIVKNERGWFKGIANAYSNIGIIYWKQGNYPQAIKKSESALTTRQKINDKRGIAGSFNNIGTIYQSMGNYPEALKNQIASLKIREDIKDMQGIAFSYNNIGIIYYLQHNYPEALINHFASLKIKKNLGDKQGLSNTYNNIGIIYYLQGNFSKALNNHLAALKIKENIKDIQGMATCYNNIGLIYDRQNNYPEAMKNYFSALKIRMDINDKEGIADSYNSLGHIHTKLNQFKKAKNYLNKSLQFSVENGYKGAIKVSYYTLSILDSMQGNWKDAYQHHQLFIVYRDIIDNEETRKKTTEIILTNKFEKQEAATKAEQDKKDTITSANKKRQELILILVSFVLILVFIFSGFVVRSLRITRKQKRIIEFQKNEVSLQKELVSEKNKEITDSINYAQRIQRALLASVKMLDANLIKSNSGLVSESQQMLKDIQHDKDYFIFFQPKDIVSGDFYWASPLANGNFALVTADSTGHGVPGAIMSMLNISCLNEAVKGQQLTEPSEILNYTRSKIIEHLSNDGSAEGGKDGMDCSLISFDFNTNSSIGEDHEGRLTYSAANNPIWIVRKKQIIELEPDKMPVGKHTQDSIPFTQHTVELEKGDIVYAITDG